MKHKKSMETIRNELLLQHLSLERGILPIQLIAEEREAAMASLSPEEQRITKRKYRKLWRKLARGEKSPRGKSLLGYGTLRLADENPAAGGEPNDLHRVHRKAAVYLDIFSKMLEIVRKIEGKDEGVTSDDML